MEENKKILIVNKNDKKVIEAYHSKWYGDFEINLTDDMIKSLNEGKVLLYNNNEYSFEIKKHNNV